MCMCLRMSFLHVITVAAVLTDESIPLFHYPYRLFSLGSRGADIGRRRVHPGRVASPSQGSYREPFTLTFTPTGHLEVN